MQGKRVQSAYTENFPVRVLRVSGKSFEMTEKGEKGKRNSRYNVEASCSSTSQQSHTQKKLRPKSSAPFQGNSKRYYQTDSSESFPKVMVRPFIEVDETTGRVPRMVRIIQHNNFLKEKMRIFPWKYQYQSIRQNLQCRRPNILLQMMVHQFFPYSYNSKK